MALGDDLEDEEELAQSSAVKDDFSRIFDFFDQHKKNILLDAIDKKQVKDLDDDKQSFYSYIERHRHEIPSDHVFWKDIAQIQSVQQDMIRDMMKESGEQVLKFSDSGGEIPLDGGGAVSYQVVDKLKIVDAKPTIKDGPLCLSLPLQDKNGRNMKDEGAKYLLMKYNRDGKLTYIEHPEPIEFEGNKCCFKIEGKKYYLKMEKQKLEELKKEIEKNHGYVEGIDAKDTALRSEDKPLPTKDLPKDNDMAGDGYVVNNSNNKEKPGLDQDHAKHSEKMRAVLDDIKKLGEWKPKPPPKDIQLKDNLVPNNVDNQKNLNLDHTNHAEQMKQVFQEMQTPKNDTKGLRRNNASNNTIPDSEITNPQDKLGKQYLDKLQKGLSKESQKYYKENPPSKPFNPDFLQRKNNSSGRSK